MASRRVSLPLDPDADTVAETDPSQQPGDNIGPGDTKLRASRPLHLRWRALLLVLCGGMLGTALRLGVMLLLPPATVGSMPYLAVVNLTGSFLLGFLLVALAELGPDDGPRRTARLLLGTGALGAFTTYSSLAGGDVLFVLGSAVAGWLCASVGMWLAAALFGNRGTQDATAPRQSARAR